MEYGCERCKDECILADGSGCPECCEHEFDWDEGYTCLNCGEQGDVGALIDAAEYDMDR